MSGYLGIDTSNYTSSAALYDSEKKIAVGEKRPLTVKDGAVGLRQSDAVFSHVKELGNVVERLMTHSAQRPAAVGVSTRPRGVEGSYMPCFLAGEMAARTATAALGVPLHAFTHQDGHIAAALYSTGRLELLGSRFIAMHISGGTTDCLLVEGDGKRFSISTLASTLDLNTGQAIDRIGSFLGLSFPAGAALDKLSLTSNQSYRIRPSFVGKNPAISGLENICKKMIGSEEPPENVAKYCIEYVCSVVAKMTEDALKDCGSLPLIYSGGVMANSIIQKRIGEKYGGFFAEPALSTDNAVGIALLTAAAEDML